MIKLNLIPPTNLHRHDTFNEGSAPAGTANSVDSASTKFGETFKESSVTLLVPPTVVRRAPFGVERTLTNKRKPASRTRLLGLPLRQTCSSLSHSWRTTRSISEVERSKQRERNGLFNARDSRLRNAIALKAVRTSS